MLKRITMVLTIMIISFIESYSQCDQGYNNGSLITPPDAYGCQWEVNFCYLCSPQGLTSTSLLVNFIKPYPIPSDCIAPERDFIIEQLVQKYVELCTIPPCNLGCLTITTSYPVCWVWYTRGFEENGELHYNAWMESCPGSALCMQDYFYCYENGEISSCGDPSPNYLSKAINCATDIWILKPEQPVDYSGEPRMDPMGCFWYYRECD